MLLDLDVIIEADAALLPGGELERLGRQGLQRGSFDVVEQARAAGAEMPGDAIVESRDAVTNGLVQLGQREEPDIAQLGDDPACRQENADLDLGVAVKRASGTTSRGL